MLQKGLRNEEHRGGTVLNKLILGGAYNKSQYDSMTNGQRSTKWQQRGILNPRYFTQHCFYDERVVLSIDIQIGMHFYAREAALWLLSHFATVIRSHSLASTDRLSLCRFALPKLHGRKDLGF